MQRPNEHRYAYCYHICAYALFTCMRSAMYERKSNSHNNNTHNKNQIDISSDKNDRKIKSKQQLNWCELIAELCLFILLVCLSRFLYSTIEELMCLFMNHLQRTNYFIEQIKYHEHTHTHSYTEKWIIRIEFRNKNKNTHRSRIITHIYGGDVATFTVLKLMHEYVSNMYVYIVYRPLLCFAFLLHSTLYHHACVCGAVSTSIVREPTF